MSLWGIGTKKSFNYFPRKILREIYAHTHGLSYGLMVNRNKQVYLKQTTEHFPQKYGIFIIK